MGNGGCAICPAEASASCTYTVLNGHHAVEEPLCESCATVVATAASVDEFQVSEHATPGDD